MKCCWPVKRNGYTVRIDRGLYPGQLKPDLVNCTTKDQVSEMTIVEWERRVSATTDSILRGGTNIKLLEAGCGARSDVWFTAPVCAVGLDISKEQLERNSALQEKILGDVQSHSLPKEEFDVVVCWMVPRTSAETERRDA